MLDWPIGIFTHLNVSNFYLLKILFFIRFEEYPKLRELIKLKDELISDTATPPMFLKSDLKGFDLKNLGVKFDVILIEPPLEVSELFEGIIR